MRLFSGKVGALRVDDRLRLLRRLHAPERLKGVHIEGHTVNFAAEVRLHAVYKAVELRKAVHIIPHLVVGSVKDVRAVNVYVDALSLFRIDVAGDVAAPFHDQAGLARPHGVFGEHGVEKPRADE